MQNRDEKILITLSFGFLALVLFLIYINRVDEGVIIEKEFQKAHSEFEMTPTGDGSMRPQLVHYDDSWTVTIKNNSNTGKCWMNEPVWNQLEVGDWVSCNDLKKMSNKH